MKLALALGGGGFRWAYLAGFLLRARELGHEIVEIHGVSAGALVGALAIEGRWDFLAEMALKVRVVDAHRWLMGGEMAVRQLTGRLRALGTNERLWKNYIQKELRGPAPALIPGFVGAVDWRTGEYLSIPHTDSEWPRAVWGSATMGPPIWEPVEWKGRLLVDGGYVTQVPLADMQLRRLTGALMCDALVAVPTTTGKVPPASGQENVQFGSMRSVGLLAHQIEMDDLVGVYNETDVIVARPDVELGDELEAGEVLQRRRFDHGQHRAEELLGRIDA